MREKIRMEVDLNDRKYVSDKLHKHFKNQSLNLLKITFLNTYFGNFSIFKQILKDIGLCFKCFKPGLPSTGLGIIRFFNNFSIRHMQKKDWSIHDPQKVDYVIIDNCGKFVTYNKEGQIGLTIDKQDPDSHIPLEKYDGSQLFLGNGGKCKCKIQN